MPAAMPDTPQLRAARYRRRAAELRHLADAIPPHDVNRQQLLNLADDFEELAASMRTSTALN
jgi:hypothetical protein